MTEEEAKWIIAEFHEEHPATLSRDEAMFICKDWMRYLKKHKFDVVREAAKTSLNVDASWLGVERMKKSIQRIEKEKEETAKFIGTKTIEQLREEIERLLNDDR